MELQTKNRTLFGKQTNRLRREGFVPAELYGHGFKNVHLSLPLKAFKDVFREAGTSTIITLVTEDGEKTPALIVNVERDALSHEFFSVDLHHIRRDEQVRTKVPIEFSGTAPAVKAGHLVVTVLTELEVEALPAELPHHLPVDITHLADIGQTIHVSDITLPKGVRTHTPADTVVVIVSERRKEEVAPAPAPVAESETPTAPPGETPPATAPVTK